jgi:uridine phosphorylase
MTDATATFPNFPGKHDQDAIFSPGDSIDYQRRHGRSPMVAIPQGMILCYQRSLYDHVLAEHDGERVGGLQLELYVLGDTAGRVGLCGNFGFGAPVATAVLEVLIAYGARRFVSIGTAGALAKGLNVGDVVVCERAIRDEGVSHHYLPPAKYAEATPALTDRLELTLRQAGLAPARGMSWTIDALYRETVAEARHYQQEGVLTVEMEAAALFAVGRYRGIEIGAAFTISDSLAELVWDPQFHAAPTQQGLERLFRATIETLDTPPAAPE